MKNIHSKNSSVVLNCGDDQMFVEHGSIMPMPGHWAPTEQQLAEWAALGVTITGEEDVPAEPVPDEKAPVKKADESPKTSFDDVLDL